MAKKKKKSKLPKSILGIKIPKQMRRGTLAAALSSPIAVGLIAEVIYHVGEAASRRASDGAHRAGPRAGTRFAEAASQSPSALGHAVSEATHAFLDALRERQKQRGADDEDSADTATRFH